MSFNPLSVPAVPIKAPPYCVPIQSCTPLKEAPAAAVLVIPWAIYGVSQANPNAAATFDLQGQGQANKVSGIRGVYIDNTGSDGAIYLYFPDTQFTVTCPPFGTVWQPVLTNLVSGTVIGKGFSTNDTAQTTIYLCNTPTNPGYTPELDFVYPQVRCSPQISRGQNIYSNGFTSPAIGDQWNTGILNLLGASPKTATLFGSPYAQGGTITVTDLYIALSGTQSASFTTSIGSNGASGIYWELTANTLLAASDQHLQVFVDRTGTQHKLNAAETWTLTAAFGTSAAANNISYQVGFSYQGSTTQVNGTLGTLNNPQTTQRSMANFAGFQFVAPANATVQTATFIAGAGTGNQLFHCELWTDSGGSPGAQVGSDSQQSVGTSGQQVQFLFATPPGINQGQTYWLVLVADGAGGVNSNWGTCAVGGAFNSGKSATVITAIAPNQLTNNDNWQCQVGYKTL